MLGPDSFDSTDFKMLKKSIKLLFLFFSSPSACPVYGELPVSKHPQQKARDYIYISSQNTQFTGSCPPQLEYKKTSYNLQTVSLFLSRHNKLSRFLYHKISTEK